MRSAILRQFLALLLACTLPLVTLPVEASALVAPQEQPAANLSADQTDSLVAPIALYPDPLLAQILVASTYPLEVVQLQQWLDQNPGLKDKALVDAVQKQGWDPSIQALAPMPDVVKILSENIKWTTDLGNTFLAQQDDVMNAVQRMRAKAQSNGQLQTTPQQSVATQVVEEKQVIVIQPSDPDVIYVPSYDPMVVYGAPVYPYPTAWWYPGRGLAFGAGLAIGYAWGHNNWGWNCGWGGNNNININNNNNFINHYNNNNLKAGNRYNGGNNNWQHDGSHRGGTPYGNRDVANKYGGSARGDSLAQRQSTARQNPANFGNRADYGRAPDVGNRGQVGQGGQIGQGNRGQIGQGGQVGQGGMRDVSAGNRPTQMGGGNQTFGGGDRAGTRDVSRGSGNGAFGGASSGMNRSNAGRSQSRGSSSLGGRSGGFSGGRSAGGGRRR